jgi:hypothetical protein
MSHEHNPSDDFERMIEIHHSVAQANKIGEQITTSLNGYREILNHQRIVNDAHWQYTYLERLASLNYLEDRLQAGTLPKIFVREIPKYKLRFHEGVVVNFYGQFSRNERKQSTKALNAMLKDENIDEETKASIQMTFDLRNEWTFLRAWIAGRIKD